MNKELKTLGLAALTLVLGVGLAQAASSDTVHLDVSVSNAFGVDIFQASYDFGAVATGGETINTTGILVNNNSGGIREDYRLSLTDNTGDLWVASADVTAGVDEYVLQAVFQSLVPAHSSFTANDLLSDTITACSADTFSVDDNDDAGGFRGFDVTDQSDTGVVRFERTLWLRLAMPTAITGQPASRFASVTVSAIGG